MPPAPEQILSAFVHALETLTPDTLTALEPLVAEDIYFRDPFNEVQGRSAYLHIYADMYEKATDVRFKVSASGLAVRSEISATSSASSAAVTNGATNATTTTGFLAWTFECTPRSKLAEPLSFPGMSTLRWNGEGQIIEHIDFWDTGKNVYEKLPVVGAILRKIKKGFSA